MNHPTSASLFDDEGNSQPLSVVAALARSKPVTKAQHTFRRLVAKIELRREQLQQWQAYVPRYHQRLADELQPVQKKMRAAQRQLIMLIDALLNEPGRRIGSVQRAKLRQLLMTLLTDLLQHGDDTELETLHDKYSDVSREDLLQSQLEMTDMLQEVFGLDVGDDQERAATQWQEEQPSSRTRGRTTKRSKANAAKAKAEAEQAQREQAAREVSQSLREVYRKLVSALHPDREPDSDARQRKTLMMQLVNQAYEASDLLTLLGLQLEIEQIDAAHLSSVSSERLTHYNQILRKQLTDLESELDHFMHPFRCNTGQWGSALTPAFVDNCLKSDIAALKSAHRRLQHDLVAFRDPKVLLDSIKYYELEPDDDVDDPDELIDLMELMRSQEPTSERRGKTPRRR